MLLEQLANLSQIIGTIAVVVTLIYLAVQVRQGSQILRSDSKHAQLGTDQHGIYLFVEYPELSQLYCQENTPSLKEKTRLLFWIIANMRAREYEWIQYKNGVMDEESWLTYRDVIYFVLGTERARSLWDMTRGFFNDGFVAMVSEMINGTPTIDFWKQLEAIE